MNADVYWQSHQNLLNKKDVGSRMLAKILGLGLRCSINVLISWHIKPYRSYKVLSYEKKNVIQGRSFRTRGPHLLAHDCPRTWENKVD